MALGTVNGTFIYNGQPQNGATAKLWKITGFAAYADSTDKVQDNPLTAASIELNVSDGTLFTVGDVIRVVTGGSTEYMRITAISTNKLYVIRGWHGSGIVAHTQAAGQPTEAKYDDNGAISDLPLTLDGAPGTEESFAGFVAAQDYIYVAGAAKFGGITVDIGTTPNAVASVLTVECSDGATGWLACTLLDDGTDAAGASMAVDGVITFTPHVDWASDTVDGDIGFWVRLTWTVNWTAGTDIAEFDLTLLTQIDDETITPPVQDDAEATGYQQGGSVTTGVAYGGDGAYRFDAVPEGEYYASVEYDTHRSWLYALCERDDPTLQQILTTDGDIVIRNADGVVRLPAGTLGHYLYQGADRPEWAGGPSGTKEFFMPVTHSDDPQDQKTYPCARIDVGGEQAWICFFVPTDFSGITTVELIAISREGNGSAKMHLTISTNYAAMGEADNANNESSANQVSDANCDTDKLLSWDISGVLSTLAALDYVSVEALFSATVVDTNLHVLGVRFKYN